MAHRLQWLPDTPEVHQGTLAQSKTKTTRKRPFAKREPQVWGNQKAREQIVTLPTAGPRQAY